MPSKLMLVESPTKAKHLQSILGEEWRVEATFGQVWDFPRKEMGIEIQADFKPTYVPPVGKTKILARIKLAAEKAEALYIATNPDERGEAIAWQVLQLIGLPKNIPVYRLHLPAITAEAVKSALQNPAPLNVALLEVEETRRILDRLVSYNLSPAASKLLRQTVRVGRMESMALRSVVEREQTIENFQPIPYYSLSGLFQVEQVTFEAKLISFKEYIITDHLRRKSQVEILTEGIEKGVFWVDDVNTVTETIQPPPPFTTSSLMQAIVELGLPIQTGMALAQELYEGGWITYPYTDGVGVSAEAIAATRGWIEQQFGSDYLPPVTTHQPNLKQAEAIRPADVDRQPEKSQLTGDQAVLYALIWERFVASQMAAAISQTQQAKILVGTSTDQPFPLVFQTNQPMPLFDGYLRLTKSRRNLDETSVSLGNFPPFQTGQTVALLQWKPVETQTRPPNHYAVIQLSEALGQMGMTHLVQQVSVIQHLIAGGYIEIQHEQLASTSKGRALWDLLSTHFPQLFSTEYESTLEQLLRAVAEGHGRRLATLEGFWKDFKPALASFNRVALAAYTREKQGEPVGKPCPTCGAELRQRRNRAGNYLICSRYPDCSYTEGLVHQPVILRQVPTGS